MNTAYLQNPKYGLVDIFVYYDSNVPKVIYELFLSVAKVALQRCLSISCEFNINYRVLYTIAASNGANE